MIKQRDRELSANIFIFLNCSFKLQAYNFSLVKKFYLLKVATFLFRIETFTRQITLPFKPLMHNVRDRQIHFKNHDAFVERFLKCV